jgi:peptide methionine sulfoxide reductase msrA/msrB
MDLIDKTNSLSPEVRQIINDKGTEYPNSGHYNSLVTQGTYLCRKCGWALYRAGSQFSSGCGWPSFDVEIPERVKDVLDADEIRREILCNRCNAHLGHVFTGEHFTPRNRRFCVNSASLDFVENNTVEDSEEAILAGGCFWGVAYYLKKINGVLKVESGYTGGAVINPSYEEICRGNTGHFEAVRVLFDPSIVSYEEILRSFFEIHDPTQKMGQGPDLGPQYQSAVFYYNQEQLTLAQQLIQLLKNNGYPVETKLLPVTPFWPAEDYHQDYYSKNKQFPYCHHPVKRFP